MITASRRGSPATSGCRGTSGPAWVLLPVLAQGRVEAGAGALERAL
ncbi:MAG: hypothetical protein JWQ67_5, partial [Marmoricola sp.]|nr:hypothetical protein [Marmoricola sp.]